MAEQRAEGCRLYFENHGRIVMEKFQKFLESKAFADVTLICSNGQRVKAHKIVLAACSPFFENVLLLEEISPSILLPDDITKKEIEAVLEFIYKGSLDIPRTFAANFLRTGKRLQIRGLERYNSEVNPPTCIPSQEGTLPPPLFPEIRKSDNIVNVLTEATTITNQSSENDTDVQFVEENPSVVVVNESQKPDSPPWLCKTDPRYMKSKRNAGNKETDSNSVELAGQASTSANQSTEINMTLHKTKETFISSLTAEQLIKKGFDELSHYCVICDSYQKSLKEHVKLLHATLLRKEKFTCPTCPKKFFMKYGLQNHTCVA